MEQMTNKDVAVIVVLFNPTEDDISNVTSLAAHYRGVIVDNSEVAIQQNANIGNMLYVCNGANLGIAEAQNIGIRILMKEGFKCIVFFDQDSRVAIDYPLQIAKIFMKVKKDFPNLALLGPTVINKQSGQEYSSAIHKDNKKSSLFIQRRDVISSGCCISLDAIHHVGIYDTRLFIDYVDFEWCWRAEDKGLVCGITPSLCIKHKVGQNELKLGTYQVIISKPFRYFFQYRNYLWLLRRKYVPLQWKVATGIKLMSRILYFPFCVRSWKEIEKNIFKGICHGIFKQNH